MPLTLAEFVNRWKINALTERSGAQPHFIDLCEILGVPHPAATDAVGERYTFEKPVSKVYGGKGFADVWLRDHFAWEYKSKDKDLKAAYRQINDYREELGNPPLLVVCDMNRFEVHTNFTNTNPRVYSFSLDDLARNFVTATCPLPPLQVLRALFADYNVLRPDRTDAFVTQEAAKKFAKLAERLEIENRSDTDTPTATKEQIAHFLIRLLFCLFADSIGLLPDRVFRRLVEIDRFYPRRFLKKLPLLFAAMSEEDGIFGEHTIHHFNGGLFDPKDISVVQLDKADMGILYDVAHSYDWSHVAPAIFGTLFERSLNKDRRSLIGAHYTSEEDILLLIEPVVMRPLIQRWHQTRDTILTLLRPPTDALAFLSVIPEGNLRSPESATKPKEHGVNDPNRAVAPLVVIPEGNLRSSNPATKAGAPSLPKVRVGSSPALTQSSETSPTLLPPTTAGDAPLAAFFDHLAQVRLLDPACGSGNFLYVALRRLLDLWKEARDFAIAHNIHIATGYIADRMPSPLQLFGIETEFYAHELASIVVWIGFLQWKHENGILEDREPILQKLSNIEHDDAILRYDPPNDPAGKPYEPQWPKADYIVGNPPFLGGKLLRRELGDKYIDNLFALYAGRVKAESDLVVYWFEKARYQLEATLVQRAGLLATQGIRGGANRNVLERIQRTGTIFWAWSDRPWLLQGAAVHVSMIAFERGNIATTEVENKTPRGAPSLAAVPSPVRVGLQLSPAGDETKNDAAHPAFLLNGEPVPFINADLTTGSNTTSALRLSENRGICFMGTTKVGPFDIDAETARKMLAAPVNVNGRPNSDVVRPWVNATDITRRPREMFIIDFGTSMSQQDAALYELPFEYLRHHVQPLRGENNRRGYAEKWWLHGESRPELRAAVSGSRRYIATPSLSKHRLYVWIKIDVLPDHQVFVYARQDDYFFGVLHSRAHDMWALLKGTQLEDRPRYTPDSTFDTFPFPWPPGTEPTEAEDPPVQAIAEAARTLVRLRDAWLNPPGTPESELKDRTLTKLYNLRAAGKCTWLEDAHHTLDEAVLAAYGWPPTLTTQQILANLLTLNHQRAAAQPPPSPKRRSPRTQSESVQPAGAE